VKKEENDKRNEMSSSYAGGENVAEKLALPVTLASACQLVNNVA
jgi:hypothetical protein